jgi:hypothetical protein
MSSVQHMQELLTNRSLAPKHLLLANARVLALVLTGPSQRLLALGANRLKNRWHWCFRDMQMPFIET